MRKAKAEGKGQRAEREVETGVSPYSGGEASRLIDKSNFG